MVPLLAAFAFLLSLADHWTTYLCLRAPVPGWQVIEANPWAAQLFEWVGLVPGLLIDTGVTVLALGVLIVTTRFPEWLKLLLLGVVVTTTGLAVANNLEALFQLGLSPVGPL